MNDSFELVDVEKEVTDACSPVYKESSLAYVENEDMLRKAMDVHSCCSIHPEPLIEVCSVTIYPYDKNKSYKIYGEVVVCDEWGEKQLYKRGKRRYETITYGNSLLLNGPNGVVVSMVAPVLTINLKVEFKFKPNRKKTNENIWFAQGTFNLDTSTDSCYDETKSVSFKGNLGVVRVDYIVVPCGVVADVRVSITNARSECDEADIFGSITACYDKTYGHVMNENDSLKEYPSSILFKKVEHECVRVSYGDSIELCRSLVCLPAYSSLLVNVNISLKECGAAKQIVISGFKDFKCKEIVQKYISVGNFHVIVKLFWSPPYQLLSHQQSLSSSSLRMSRTMSLTAPFFGSERIDVLSVFVGNEGNETVDLCGTILVEHWVGLAYIFRRDETCPNNLSRPCKAKALSLKGVLSYYADQFFMHLRLKDRKGTSPVKIDCCFEMHDRYYDRIFRKWFDRPLCSVIIEDHCFVAVHYIVFKDAVKATVKISVVVKDSVVVAADSFPVVYGNLVAQYSKFQYSTSYERNYCRSVLFEEREENDGWQLTEEGEIPLFRNMLSVPVDSSLIVEVDLHASLRSTGVMNVSAEHLKDSVEFEIGDFGCKKIVGQNYELVLSMEWFNCWC